MHATLTLLGHQWTYPYRQCRTTVLDPLAANIVDFELAIARTRAFVNRGLLNRNQRRNFILNLASLAVMVHRSMLGLQAASNPRIERDGRCLERIRDRASITNCLLVIVLVEEYLLLVAEYFALETQLYVLILAAGLVLRRSSLHLGYRGWEDTCREGFSVLAVVCLKALGRTYLLQLVHVDGFELSRVQATHRLHVVLVSGRCREMILRHLVDRRFDSLSLLVRWVS